QGRWGIQPEPEAAIPGGGLVQLIEHQFIGHTSTPLVLWVDTCPLSSLCRWGDLDCLLGPPAGLPQLDLTEGRGDLQAEVPGGVQQPGAVLGPRLARQHPSSVFQGRGATWSATGAGSPARRA